MSKSNKQPLVNAGDIIERFGGIRPMAAKIDTPVTTVQGWKKRDVIPGTRRAQILSAAAQNNINIDDLVSGAANVSVSNTAKPKASKTKVVVENKAQEAKQSEIKEGESIAPMAAVPKAKPTNKTHDDLMATIEANNRKTMAASAWIATAFILLAIAVAAFLLWPKVQQKNEMLEAQSQKLVSLEDEVEDVNQRTSFINNIIPENMQERIDGLQNQARNIQLTVDQIAEKAQNISSSVLAPDSGPLSQRLEMLEEQMAELSNGRTDFGGLIERLRVLEDTIPGQEQLKNSVDELRNLVQSNSDATGDIKQDLINQDLADAQNQEQGALSQTLEGVSGNDLKAAAMLIAFSQLRDSLNREEPFENDLKLLEKLAGNDNPALLDALSRLAPHADGGVLTAKGLSGEFRGLAGDVVASSLKGEDISLKERATARIGNLLQVEKDGELLSGTQTQVSVAKAQKMLDEGNIQGAIAQLQTLDGDAAQTVQPFIEQAQISLLAERVQEMLGENILSQISGKLPSMGGLKEMGMKAVGMDQDVSPAPSNATIPSEIQGQKPAPAPITSNFLDMDEVKKTLEEAVPFGETMGGQEVIKDEASGITILPNSPSFKGFSGGDKPAP